MALNQLTPIHQTLTKTTLVYLGDIANFRAALSSWEAIGSPENACHLIAAVIKTCRVARELCRDLEANNQAKGSTNSYLGDMYLGQITEHLWDLWKAAGGVRSMFDY